MGSSPARVDAEQRLGRPGRRGVRGEARGERAQLRLAGEVEAERIAPRLPNSARGRDDRRMRQADRAFAAASASTVRTGFCTSSSSGTASLAMRLTNEVLAPFSSRRRTR
jgi:hypothetical protein